MRLLASTPSNFASLHALLGKEGHALPRKLLLVGKLVMSNPSDFAFGSISDVAAKAKVSPATIVRFAKLVGLHGFLDLQRICSDQIQSISTTQQGSLLGQSGGHRSASSLVETSFAEAERSIASLRQRMDASTFDSAVQQLSQAETIYVIGQHQSYPIVSYFSHLLGECGIRHMVVHSPMANDLDLASFATDRDAAIAISVSQSDSDAIGLARQIRASGARLILLTNDLRTPLYHEADAALQTCDGCFEGTPTMSGTMVMAMMLAMTLSCRHYAMPS